MLKRVCLLIVSLFFCIPAYSNSIQITPTRIDLSAREKMATLIVSNPSENPILIQTELLHWTQENGEDVYRPTEQVIVLPPAFSIAPKGRQQIRIALQHPPADVERAYRVYLREVIPNNVSQLPGLKIALRVGVPIFIAPLVQEVERLQWEVLPSKNSLVVRLNNQGNIHALISGLEFLTDENNIIEKQDVFKYLLPKQSCQWSFPFAKNANKNYQVRARVNGVSMECLPLKEKLASNE